MLLEMRRVALSVYQNKSASDAAQIPASGANAKVFRQGATVRAAAGPVAVNGTAAVSIHNLGRLLAGDTVQTNTTAATWVVQSIDSNIQVTLKNTGASSQSLAINDRLVLRAQTCILYSDSQGNIALSNSGDVTVSSSGSIAFYIAENRFDYIVTVGSSQTLFIDELGGWIRNGVAWINARDYSSASTTTAGIQEAIDSLPSGGGTVYIPAGIYNLTTTLYTPCDRPCTIVGDSSQWAPSSSSQLGTILIWSTAVDMVRLRGNSNKLSNLSLRSTAAYSASEETGRGVVIGRRNLADPHPAPGTASATEISKSIPTNDVVKSVTLDNVLIETPSSWGVFIAGVGKLSDGSTNESGISTNITLSIFVTLNKVWVHQPKNFGGLFIGDGNTTVTVIESNFTNCGRASNHDRSYYTYVRNGAGITFRNCTFEGDCPLSNAWVYVVGEVITLDGCWFEEDAGDTPGHTPQWFITTAATTTALRINAPIFIRGADTAGKPRFIQIPNVGVRGLLIMQPMGEMTTDPRPAGTWVETNHIDLGGNNVTDVVIVGSGALHYSASYYPIQYANHPAETAGMMHSILKVPQTTEVKKTDTANQLQLAGAIGLNWDIPGTGSSVGALEYFWGGSNGGWRLINNAPKMTKLNRDNRTAANWCDGDIIYVTDATAGHEIQIMKGAAWYYITTTAKGGGD